MADICYICSDKKISENLDCFTCNNALCIDCCNKLNYKKYVLYNVKNEVFLKYTCPFCRSENNKNIKLFEKKELTTFIVDLLTQHITLSDNIDKYKNNINNLTYQNNKLHYDVENKNKYITEIVNINKNNMQEFNILLKRYRSLFNY